METKMIKVPFDVEMAKNITDGEIPGKIVTRDGRSARIICWDKIDEIFPVVALVKCKEESVGEYTDNGRWISTEEDSDHDLLLEIPEYLTYKEGDIIFAEVDNGCDDHWKWLSIVKDIDYILGPYVKSYVDYNLESPRNCRSLEFNQTSDNISIIRRATEEEKTMFKERLKKSNEPEAKEYLNRFFADVNSPKVSNSEKIGKKEEKAKEFINKEFDCKACESAAVCKFGSGYDSAELYDCNAERYLEIYEEAWDACMKHLASIPWDEAVNEIVNSIS